MYSRLPAGSAQSNAQHLHSKANDPHGGSPCRNSISGKLSLAAAVAAFRLQSSKLAGNRIPGTSAVRIVRLAVEVLCIVLCAPGRQSGIRKSIGFKAGEGFEAGRLFARAAASRRLRQPYMVRRRLQQPRQRLHKQADGPSSTGREPGLSPPAGQSDQLARPTAAQEGELIIREAHAGRGGRIAGRDAPRARRGTAFVRGATWPDFERLMKDATLPAAVCAPGNTSGDCLTRQDGAELGHFGGLEQQRHVITCHYGHNFRYHLRAA